MKNSYAVITIFILLLEASSFAQRPGGPPGAGGPPPREGRPMGDLGPNGPGGGPPRQKDWTKTVDTDKNGSIDATEFQTAIDKTFASLDKDGNGVIDANEMPAPPKGENGRPPMGQGGGQPGMMGQGQRPPMGQGGSMPGMDPGQQGPPMGRGGQPGGMDERGPGQPPDEARSLPPFFFMDLFKDGGSVTKADFDRKAKEVFAAMDTNHDGVLSREESKPPKGPGPGPGAPPEGERPPPPNAMFIAAELRFGDKLVAGQPFSADTVIEDTHRLYDGSTVTKKNSGLIYRDSAGRTRREQPLDMVGNFGIVNDQNKPQTLVFINDFAAKTQYFLDVNNKVARKGHIGNGGPAPEGPNQPKDAKSESLGTKTIEGVSVEGTRITFEIPAGQIGNDKPMEVVTENWYSPELQIMIMSRHTDPLAGEHVFKLVNIKRSEPAADLFTIPAGFRIENSPDRGPGR